MNELLDQLGQAGSVLALTGAAFGSAVGTGIAGLATLGAWKKSLLEGKPIPFILVAFAGAPLSQTIYGMILMNSLRAQAATASPLALFTAGLSGGIAMAASAWQQGKAGAAAADAFAATGRAFGNYIMILGIIETVALFVMVFLMRVVS